MLREYDFHHRATNELVQLTSASRVSREHTSGVRHALFLDEMGTGPSDRSQEGFWEGRTGCRGSRAPLPCSSWRHSGAGLEGVWASECWRNRLWLCRALIDEVLGEGWWLKRINRSTVLLVLASLARVVAHLLARCGWVITADGCAGAAPVLCMCPHCRNKQNWTLKANPKFVTTCARADLHRYFPYCFPFCYFSVSCL